MGKFKKLIGCGVVFSTIVATLTGCKSNVEIVTKFDKQDNQILQENKNNELASDKIQENENNELASDKIQENKNNELASDKIQENKNNELVSDKIQENNQNNSIKDDNIQTTEIEQIDKFVGKYSNYQTTENYYHSAEATIDSITTEYITFSINAAHGKNADSVNIGEVKGMAKKISIPEDKIVPNAQQLAYEFKETISGKTSSITFVLTQHKKFIYLDIIENYENDFNPYAGHNVRFAGEYDKIK